jgi:hypothetical protein
LGREVRCAGRMGSRKMARETRYRVIYFDENNKERSITRTSARSTTCS